MVTIAYTVRPSCKSNERLFVRSIPHSHGCNLTEDELFGYATLKLQDSRQAQRLTFSDTRPLLSSLRSLHGIYLSLDSCDILCTAGDEDLTQISELIGIGCGVAAIVASMSVNPNRFKRIITSGKRMDFEFQHLSKICQLEVKGTTYPSKHKGMIKAAKTKKGPGVRRFDASFGAVTLYSTPLRRNGTEVVIVDPPARGAAHVLRRPPEVANLLRHYLPYLQAVLIQNEFTSWLLKTLVAMESTGNTPSGRSPSRPLHRVPENVDPYGRFLGTIFDPRATREAMAAYEDFESATAALGDFSTFIGVHSDVINAIADSDWNQLLMLAWPAVSDETRTLLPSGVLIMRIQTTPEEKSVMRSNFATGRTTELRRRRLLAGG